MYVYSIFDDKASTYNTPFFDVSDASASRNFGRLALDADSLVNYSPSDFHLYCVGEFDEVNGSFVLQPNPKFICHAMQFITSSLIDTASDSQPVAQRAR